jgi:hypothetical protein
MEEVSTVFHVSAFLHLTGEMSTVGALLLKDLQEG